MFAVETGLPSRDRVIRWCVHSPSMRTDCVGRQVIDAWASNSRPSAASAKIGTPPYPTEAEAESARLGVDTPAFPRARLYSPCGLTNGVPELSVAYPAYAAESDSCWG